MTRLAELLQRYRKLAVLRESARQRFEQSADEMREIEAEIEKLCQPASDASVDFVSETACVQVESESAARLVKTKPSEPA